MEKPTLRKTLRVCGERLAHTEELVVFGALLCDLLAQHDVLGKVPLPARRQVDAARRVIYQMNRFELQVVGKHAPVSVSVNVQRLLP